MKCVSTHPANVFKQLKGTLLGSIRVNDTVARTADSRTIRFAWIHCAVVKVVSMNDQD